MTAPNQEATLAAVQPGRIGAVLVAEGQPVSQGDLVFILEDGVQRAQTEIARATAESTLDIDLAAALWERARLELERLEALNKKHSVSIKELNDARSDEKTTRIEHELAKFEHHQAVLAHRREEETLKEYSARAPFTGYVSEQLKYVGETVEESEGVVTLVQLDPLKVLVDCPIDLAPHIRTGDQVLVRTADLHQSQRWGTVTLASRVADGASQTFKVKINVPNEGAEWLSGLKVNVDLPGRRPPKSDDIALVPAPPTKDVSATAGLPGEVEPE